MERKKIAIIGLTGQSIFLNIDNFHKDGETKQANNLYIEPGGKGYNQAVACKKLDSEVYFLTSVGKDEYGKVCEQVLIDLGVNTYFSKKDESTALATIITNSNGDNQVTVYKGASDLLNLNDLNNFKEIIKQCDILLVQNEIPYEVLKEAIIYAKKNNVFVIYNPAPAIYDINELLPYINVLIPNESEFKTLFNKPIDEIEIKNDLELIVTLGKDGCVYKNKNITKYYPSIKVNAIDTTGAGDVFCSGICSFMNNKTITDETIHLATISSSIHVQRKYIINAAPSKEEVINKYNELFFNKVGEN